MMLSVFVVLLLAWLPTLSGFEVDLSDPTLCEYTEEVLEYEVSLLSNFGYVPLVTMSVGQRRVWVMVESALDFDIEMYTGSGSLVLGYGGPASTNWYPISNSFSVSGVDYESCVDNCGRSLSVGPLYDGMSHEVHDDGT